MGRFDSTPNDNRKERLGGKMEIYWHGRGERYGRGHYEAMTLGHDLDDPPVHVSEDGSRLIRAFVAATFQDGDFDEPDLEQQLDQLVDDVFDGHDLQPNTHYRGLGGATGSLSILQDDDGFPDRDEAKAFLRYAASMRVQVRRL